MAIILYLQVVKKFIRVLLGSLMTNLIIILIRLLVINRCLVFSNF